MNEPYIQIRDIKMWYPYRKSGPFNFGGRAKWVKAVDGVSLAIEKGSILGVIGESGCGKSTLGRVLAGLENPTGGDVLIGGVSSRELLRRDPMAFRRSVQIIFQNPFDTFTPRGRIGGILKRPLKLHGIGADESARDTLCVEALEKSGLIPARDIMNRFPHELSGGQLQRISIIRSMFMNPGFVIADEPVSMLDVSVRSDIINTLLDLRRGSGAAIMFISHDIALTRYISDGIAVLYLGRVVEYAGADELIHGPRHPYTQALISNCGSIDPDGGNEPITVTGEPPTPVNPGPGCYFAGRCPYALPACRERYPETVDLGNGHSAACHLCKK
jgi:peptide/nickel transport system ATP-binding protein